MIAKAVNEFSAADVNLVFGTIAAENFVGLPVGGVKRIVNMRFNRINRKARQNADINSAESGVDYLQNFRSKKIKKGSSDRFCLFY